MEMVSFYLVHYEISQTDRTSNQLKLLLLPPKIAQQSKVLKKQIKHLWILLFRVSTTPMVIISQGNDCKIKCAFHLCNKSYAFRQQLIHCRVLLFDKLECLPIT